MEEKNNVQSKKKGPKMVVLIVVGIILIMLLGMQVFASVNGYGNIFFMIKNLVTTGTLTGEEEIFSDKEITLSYQSIDIAEGVKAQINKLEIKENESTLCLTIKANEENKVLPLKYSMKSEGLSETEVKGENSTETYGEFEERLTVNYKFSDDELMTLYIKDKDGNLLREIEINLGSHEIFVKGEDEFAKISQIELKKYLNAFSRLNNDSKKTNQLIQIAYDIHGIALPDRLDAPGIEEMNEAMKEFYGDKVKFEKVKGESGAELEILKVDGEKVKYSEKSNIYSLDEDLDNCQQGICLKIEDIDYRDGIYTVKYIYTLATNIDIIDGKIEELPQYEATIKLKRNEDAKYSKYQIVELSKGTEVKEKVSVDIEDENDEVSNKNVEKLIQRYYDLLGAWTGSPDGLLIELGYTKSEVYQKNAQIVQGDNQYYKTKIDYSDFKAKMLDVVSEHWYKERFDRNYKEIDGKVCYSDGGATGIDYVVKSVKNTNENKYNIVLSWTNVDDSKEEMSDTLTLLEKNGKYVIDSVASYEEWVNEFEEHEHNYVVVQNSGTKGPDGAHTTLDGTHKVKCTICGEEKEEPHKFGKWFTIYNGTAWTLWCDDCKDYIYTTDYSVVENSGYGMNESSINSDIAESDDISLTDAKKVVERYYKLLSLSTTPEQFFKELGFKYPPVYAEETAAYQYSYDEYKSKMLELVTERVFNDHFAMLNLNGYAGFKTKGNEETEYTLNKIESAISDAPYYSFSCKVTAKNKVKGTSENKNVIVYLMKDSDGNIVVSSISE